MSIDRTASFISTLKHVVDLDDHRSPFAILRLRLSRTIRERERVAMGIWLYARLIMITRLFCASSRSVMIRTCDARMDLSTSLFDDNHHGWDDGKGIGFFSSRTNREKKDEHHWQQLDWERTQRERERGMMISNASLNTSSMPIDRQRERKRFLL